MTTDRSYRRARSTAAALQELEACAWSQFDPDVVRVLAELIGSGRVALERPAQLVAVAAPRIDSAMGVTGIEPVTSRV
jgi:HD-GYP domain-containing protein (c-di-GMP phosphodiesterase class II)